MNAVAMAKGAKISPRKAGLVSALVRGRSVEDALIILDHTPKKAALIIKKVIESAKANATNNHNLKTEGLIIAEITVGHGPALKRYRPVAFGRAHPFKKRTSHIKVILKGDAKVKKTTKPVIDKQTKSKPKTVSTKEKK